MSLKKYQLRVLDEFSVYLEALAKERLVNPRYAALGAWDAIGRTRSLPAYRPKRTGSDQDLPWVCTQVPTGGGKTLLATQIIALAFKKLLPYRNGGGLVVWVVVSDQIYVDTLSALRDRGHFYRESLEIALSRRIQIWEKHEIHRITPSQVSEDCNILLLKLQGTNREDKEALKFFRDTGGNITRFFPPEDDFEAHAALINQTRNLDTFGSPGTGEVVCKTSVANLVRLLRPVVIIDEGQKAASSLARTTICGFNPEFVVELSATPPDDASKLSIVTGSELLKEEMIKLPINVATDTGGTWGQCLSRASHRLRQLETIAQKYGTESGAWIRPMSLVQVERTGRDQRTPEYIHAEDVRDYLINSLGFSAEEVRVKSSETNDIEGVDLMNPECPVRWIITKSALQEGWDCPFAYILVSLANTQSRTSMTQLVGRVLRQPWTKKTPYDELNESYVYCLHTEPTQVVTDIHSALRREGLEGDTKGWVDTSSEGVAERPLVSIIKPEFETCYGRPKAGHVLLPRFCWRTEKGEWQKFDPHRHLIPTINFADLSWKDEVSRWDYTKVIEAASEYFYKIQLGDEILYPLDSRRHEIGTFEDDSAATAWLTANLGIEWLGWKTLRRIVHNVVPHLRGVEGHLTLARFAILEDIRGLILRWVDDECERIFDEAFQQDRINFSIDKVDFTHVVQRRVRRVNPVPLLHSDGTSMQRSLFDPPPDEVNDYEKSIARVVDKNDKVTWWFRNNPTPEGFWIQGPRRQRIYPDYVIQRRPNGRPAPTVLFLEAKGKHLEGNPDTAYKRRVATYFQQLGVGGPVLWQDVVLRELNSSFDKHHFAFYLLDQGEYPGESWREALHEFLEPNGH